MLSMSSNSLCVVGPRSTRPGALCSHHELHWGVAQQHAPQPLLLEPDNHLGFRASGLNAYDHAPTPLVMFDDVSWMKPSAQQEFKLSIQRGHLFLDQCFL